METPRDTSRIIVKDVPVAVLFAQLSHMDPRADEPIGILGDLPDGPAMLNLRLLEDGRAGIRAYELGGSPPLSLALVEEVVVPFDALQYTLTTCFGTCNGPVVEVIVDKSRVVLSGHVEEADRSAVDVSSLEKGEGVEELRSRFKDLFSVASSVSNPDNVVIRQFALRPPEENPPPRHEFKRVLPSEFILGTEPLPVSEVTKALFAGHSLYLMGKTPLGEALIRLEGKDGAVIFAAYNTDADLRNNRHGMFALDLPSIKEFLRLFGAVSWPNTVAFAKVNEDGLSRSLHSTTPRVRTNILPQRWDAWHAHSENVDRFLEKP